MKEVRLQFIEAHERTQSVQSFRFIPQETIDFLPGQFLQIIFDEHNKNNGSLNKYLSFSCAPGKEYIEVTKRISDSQFSQRLLKLQHNDSILCKAPMGTCVYKDEYKKIGFLIGGIGITPVISILEYIIERGLKTDVCVLYSNRVESDIPFKPVLDTWRMRYAHIRITYTLTDCNPDDKTCLTGLIDKEKIFTFVPDWQQRVMFVLGAPSMVSAMKSMCEEISCPINMIKTESFIGY